MDVPRLEGHEVLMLHDYGGCGRVYRVVDVAGTVRALKVFDDLSVSRALLAKMAQRLRVDGWPQGVMPWELEQLGSSPLHVLMPWLADDGGDGSWRPRSLQHRMSGVGRNEAWRLIRALAGVLAGMHVRHVPHGNLKPGNIFLDRDGGVLVSDWCLGNMPGVHVFHFTDALLYQPPEQLLDTSGYLDEQGYGWDVYAFGVIAFRLLTGHFPRCDEVFAKVAPAEGVTRCEGLKADPEKLARNLKAASIKMWPEPARDEMERRMREWIVRCLEIDPARRPASMADLCAGFDLIETEVTREKEIRGLELRVRMMMVAALVLIAMICGLGFTVSEYVSRWHAAEGRLVTEQQVMADERVALAAAVDEAGRVRDQAMRVRDEAMRAEAEARRVLLDERQIHLERLEASRLVGDRLFTWAMEKGRRRLPPLDGRALRLQRLEDYFKSFLKDSEGREELAQDRARVRLQLAEIAISEGNVPLAMSRLGEAVEAWKDQPKGAELMLRLATDRLMLAMLHDERSDPLARAAYQEAREAMAMVPRDRVDGDRFDQLMAVLDFREAKLLAAAGDEQRALAQLMRATKVLNGIAGRRPDVAILRSALADCYLSSAQILEGLGSMGDAREVRLLACEELERMHKGKPDDLTIQSELAGCYGAIAEAAILSGDMEEAERRTREALVLWDKYLTQRPRDDAALDRKASLLGLQAGIRRDRGEVAEATKLYEQAMMMLEAIHDRSPEHVMASYHLALIWWQKGRMSGMHERGGDIAMMRKASQLLGELEEAPSEDGPRPEQLMRSRAYLAGDLGHAFDLKDQQDKAKLAFADAVERWQKLLGMRPRNEEYRQALDWCRERLKGLN